MPLIARRGSVSSRTYGQLNKTQSLPTVSTYSGIGIFDNDYDVTIFTFTKYTRLAVSPFSQVSNIYQSATTNDDVTWNSPFEASGPFRTDITPATGFASWGAGLGKYHVVSGSDIRRWMQTYYDATANVVIQKQASSALAGWDTDAQNLITLVPGDNLAYRNWSSLSGTVSRGANIWKNLNYSSVPFGTSSNVGPIAPILVKSENAGITYATRYDYTGRAAPMTNYTSNNSAFFGNVDPTISWSGAWNSYNFAPYGIWDSNVGGAYAYGQTYFVGSGGSMFNNTGNDNTWIRNDVLRNLIGPYTSLFKVSASGPQFNPSVTKLAVIGCGTLAGTNTFTWFTASSTDSGVTWSRSTNIATLMGAQGTTTSNSLPDRVTFLVYDGTRYIVGFSNGASAVKVATSPDGLTWTALTSLNSVSGSVPQWNFMTYNGTRWLAGGSGGYIATSTDFSTWTVTRYISTLGSSDVAAGLWDGVNSRYVVVTSAGSSVSADGVTWSIASSGSNWSTVTGSATCISLKIPTYTVNDKYFALTRDQKMLISTNGTSWATFGSVPYPTAVANGGGCGRTIGVYTLDGASYSVYVWGDVGVSYGISTSGANTWTAGWNIDNIGRFNLNRPLLIPTYTKALDPMLTINTGGTGYTANTVNVRFSDPDDARGWHPTIASISVSGGAVTAITLGDVGAGYNTPPTVTVTSSTGSGAGANVTTRFKTALSNSSITMRRIMSWNQHDSYGEYGFGWFGLQANYTNADFNATVGSYPRTNWNIAVVPGAGDVADAQTAQYYTQSALSTTAFHTNIECETDTDEMIYTTVGSARTFTGTPPDSSYRRILHTLDRTSLTYDRGNIWLWTESPVSTTDNFVAGVAGSQYQAGPWRRAQSYYPVYDASAPTGDFPTYRPGLLWYVSGVAVTSVYDSAGQKKMSTTLWIKTYRYNLTNRTFDAWGTGSLPVDSRWTGVLSDPSTNIGGLGGMGFAGNGLQPTVRSSMVMAYGLMQTLPGSFGSSYIQVAFRTTDGGNTWTEATDLLSWMTANGYAQIGQLYWNTNEGHWVMILGKTVGSWTEPPTIVTTTDFITYNQYSNSVTVNIPTT